MFRNRLRGIATALVLGTATIAAAGVMTIIPAEAGVRPAVGKPLQEARSLAGSGNYSAAMAKVREAEGVGGLTGEERSVVSQMRNYIAAKSGGGGSTDSAVGVRAKFANDYRSGRYGEVIRDADLLRKYGALDSQSMRIVAQAYYQLRDYSGCLRYIRNNLGLNGATALAMSCAAQAGDSDAMRDLAREAVISSPTPDNWGRLLRSAEGTKGLGDHETLDLYRLKKLTGTLKTVDDYALLSQLAIQFGSPAESYGVVQSAFTLKIMSGDRWTRLLNLAKTQSDQAAANLGKNLASAKSEKRGDSLLRLGEYQVGAGKPQDGVATIQAALAKGVADQDGGKLRLGYAQLMAGQKDAATRTFNSIKGQSNQQTIAQIWLIYARTSK